MRSDEFQADLRCWYKKGVIHPVDRHLDHVSSVVEHPELFGFTQDDVDDASEEEDGVTDMVIMAGWSRINIEQTTIPYIISNTKADAKSALKMVLRRVPDLSKLSVEIYKPVFSQFTLTDTEIDEFVG